MTLGQPVATGAALVLAGVAAAVWREAPVVAAGALLHPARSVVGAPPPGGCVDATLSGAGVSLRAWRCSPAGQARGTIVLLHGIADNRGGWRGAVGRLRARGFAVVAYDSRAHGESSGSACTYGFFEKQDLRLVVDSIDQPAIVIGHSLGAAVALQEAADDPRIRAVVAAAPFSDLRTVATERAPGWLPAAIVRRAFVKAEQEAGFEVDAVSPQADARHIAAPVLLLHGGDDLETPVEHSRRIYAALAGPKQLIIVPGAGHNDVLSADATWHAIEHWLEVNSRLTNSPTL